MNRFFLFDFFHTKIFTAYDLQRITFKNSDSLFCVTFGVFRLCFLYRNFIIIVKRRLRKSIISNQMKAIEHCFSMLPFLLGIFQFLIVSLF